jgi:hypothetical protein
MIAMRWAVLAVATVLTLAAFGATGTDLQPSALRVAVTAIVGLLAPLFWPGIGATAARTTLRIVGWSLAAACLAAIALRFAGNHGQPFARILPACAMLMLILLVIHALAAIVEQHWRSKSGNAESSHEMAGRTAALVLALLGAVPLWLGPAAELLARRQAWIIDAVIGVSPLTHPGGCERQRSAAQPVVLSAFESRSSTVLVSQPDDPHRNLRRHRPHTGTRPAGGPGPGSPDREHHCNHAPRHGARQMMKRLVLAACASLVLAPSATYAAEATMDPQLREKARRAVDAGLHYLRGQQAADGSVARSVGVTALSLRAFLESHRGYNESDGPFITRQVEFVLSKVQSDGSISESLQNTAYNTAVSMNALACNEEPEVRKRHVGRTKVPDQPSDR